jgi:hypothetical protein
LPNPFAASSILSCFPSPDVLPDGVGTFSGLPSRVDCPVLLTTDLQYSLKSYKNSLSVSFIVKISLTDYSVADSCWAESFSIK